MGIQKSSKIEIQNCDPKWRDPTKSGDLQNDPQNRETPKSIQNRDLKTTKMGIQKSSKIETNKNEPQNGDPQKNDPQNRETRLYYVFLTTWCFLLLYYTRRSPQLELNCKINTAVT